MRVKLREAGEKGALTNRSGAGPGSQLRAPAPAPYVPAASSLVFPLTCPGNAAGSGAARPGGGTPPAVGWRRSGPAARRAPLATVVGSELRPGRAAPFAEPGRSALCPLPPAGRRRAAFRAPAPGLPAAVRARRSAFCPSAQFRARSVQS